MSDDPSAAERERRRLEREKRRRQREGAASDPPAAPPPPPPKSPRPPKKAKPKRVHSNHWRAGVALALAAVFLGLRYWLLPNIENYRGDIVAKVSSAIGLPVKIGAITTDWQGLRPRLSTADVRIYDSSGREALVLPAVENVIGWRSLFFGELRSHSFVIDRPKLQVRRDANGEIYVAGIRVSGGKGEGRVSDWILSQSEIVVRDAEIEWRDDKREAPPLRLSALNFRLRNDGDDQAAKSRTLSPSSCARTSSPGPSSRGGSAVRPAA